MERFLKRHEGRVLGTIAGFDRVLFRGNLSSICHPGGMDRFMSSQRVLYKDFKPFVEKISERVKEHAKQFAAAAQRPFIYLAFSRESKEERARQIVEQDQITEGLICVLSCLEPCRSFGIRRDAQSKRLYLIKSERKCLHLYFYFADREFGLMHVPISPEDSRVFNNLLRGEFLIQGIRNYDLRQHLYPQTNYDPDQRRKDSARVTRYLGLLRSHDLIYRVPKTNYYRVTKQGHEVMSTAIKFRETNVALLAA